MNQIVCIYVEQIKGAVLELDCCNAAAGIV